MYRLATPLLAVAFHLAAALLATGCATAPSAPPDEPAEARPTAERPLDARSLLAAAEQAPKAEAQRLRLRAAMDYAQRGDAAAVAGILDALDRSDLIRPQDRRRHDWLAARLALDGGDARRALSLLERGSASGEEPPSPADPARTAGDAVAPEEDDRAPSDADLRLATGVRAEALAATGDAVAAARSRVFLDGLLPPEQRRANREAIWRDLARADGPALEAARARAGGEVFRGWLDLALVARAMTPTLEAQQRAFDAWRRDHPDHPALDAMPERLARLPALIAQRPRHVALLLPLSGPLASAGRAVRDGFSAAHLQALEAGGAAPRLTFLDAHALGAGAAYLQALDFGADLVVGPLAKEAVDELAALPTREIPILALNTTTAATRVPNLVQFALLPEDEGMQLAERARRDGAERALVVARDALWARRLVAAFRVRFEALGGEVVTEAGFAATSEAAGVVADALLIDESESRVADLRRVLGGEIEFEPRRRTDVDAILAISDPTGARTLKPALDYYFAGDLPVYASSHIHEGPGAGSDGAALDGVRFCDMPWRLDRGPEFRAFHDAWPDASAAAATFHALGIDAWRLHGQLPVLDDDATTWAGLTGELRLDADGRLRRELQWAIMRDGRALPLPRVVAGGAGR